MSSHWIFALSVAGLIALVSFLTVRSGELLRTWTPHHNLILSVPDNLARLALVGVCLLLGYTVGPGPQALGWQTTYLSQDLILGTVVGLVLAILLALGGQVAVRRWGPELSSEKVLRCTMPINRREWVWVLIALLPAAALEELLFRSMTLGGLSWLVRPWWMVWPLALLFGLLHWPQGGWGVVGATFAALAFSLLFLATGGIWAPLSAHYVMNVCQTGLARRAGLKPLRAP